MFKQRNSIAEIMIENKQLRARNTLLEEKIKTVENLNELYTEDFMIPKYHVERYFETFPNKHIDKTKLKPLYHPKKYISRATSPIQFPLSLEIPQVNLPSPPSIFASEFSSPVHSRSQSPSPEISDCLHHEYLKCKSDSDIVVPVKVNRFKHQYVDKTTVQTNCRVKTCA